jgi:hypothetical protein
MARLIDALEQILDSAGDPLVLGLLDFYETGGSTVRKTTYADSAETIANANPVVLGGDGVVPNIFGTGTYRVVVRTAAGAQLRQRDPVGGDDSLGFGSDWSSTISYGLAEVVKEDGQYWESQTAANAGNQPSLDGGTNWLLFLADVATNTADIATNTAAIAGKADLTGAAFTGALSSTAGNVNLKSNTPLSDAAATLTAAQLIGGEFTITPTVARIQTTDTATAIIAALGGSADNSNFDITMINLAAFDVTIAAGAGVTLVGNMVVNDGSATFRVRRLTASTVSVTRLETGVGVSTKQTMHVQYQLASATAGGTFTAGAWQTEPLNTEVQNNIAGASLLSNQVTLPAGDYILTSWAVAYNTTRHQLKIRNTTDASDAVIGASGVNSATGSQSIAIADGPISITSTKVFEIQHHCAATATTNGFGVAAAFGTANVYADILIEKIG